MTTKTQTDRTTDQKIDSLQPGGSIQLSRTGNTRVIAERTGDGRRLLIFREYLEFHDLAGQRVLGYEIFLDQVW